ncbi:MAG: GNAT family N-acetyltransferase [Actinomycetota bacterium]|nr:GNAT family N-acetyltransferase [Actinomycetota bacterium]
MPEIRLRPATETDAAFLTDVVIEATRDQQRLAADFDEQSFRERFQQWTLEQIAAADADNAVSVIELDGQPAGRLRVVRTADSIELAGIQFRPRYQSSGVGSSIIDGLKAEAVASDRTFTLGVEKDNPRARSLYQRLGFVQTGESDSEYLMRWDPSFRAAPVNLAE